MEKRVDMSEGRFWRLYQEERRKVAADSKVLSGAQIVRCAREARRRQAEG